MEERLIVEDDGKGADTVGHLCEIGLLNSPGCTKIQTGLFRQKDGHASSKALFENPALIRSEGESREDPGRNRS